MFHLLGPFALEFWCDRLQYFIFFNWFEFGKNLNLCFWTNLLEPKVKKQVFISSMITCDEELVTLMTINTVCAI
jgi:hypothetical protein